MKKLLDRITEPVGKEAALDIIRKLAEENGIKIMVFKTKDEMNEVLEDMRSGARVRAAYKEYDIEVPKEYLM